jgi:hypothetical protein
MWSSTLTLKRLPSLGVTANSMSHLPAITSAGPEYEYTPFRTSFSPSLCVPIAMSCIVNDTVTRARWTGAPFLVTSSVIVFRAVAWFGTIPSFSFLEAPSSAVAGPHLDRGVIGRGSGRRLHDQGHDRDEPDQRCSPPNDVTASWRHDPDKTGAALV